MEEREDSGGGVGGGSPVQPSKPKYWHNHPFSLLVGKFLRFEGPYLQPLSLHVSETLPSR